MRNSSRLELDQLSVVIQRKCGVLVGTVLSSVQWSSVFSRTYSQSSNGWTVVSCAWPFVLWRSISRMDTGQLTWAFYGRWLVSSALGQTTFFNSGQSTGQASAFHLRSQVQLYYFQWSVVGGHWSVVSGTWTLASSKDERQSSGQLSADSHTQQLVMLYL